MVSSSLPSVPTQDPGAPALPDDWPALWQQLLQARAQPLQPTATGAWLRTDGPNGWQLFAPCSAGSAALFQVYKPLLDARRAQALDPASPPWVLAQLGQSLDACVATAAGDSYYVTGPHSLLHLHRLRALCDAVLVGAGTVAADDPQLTTRRVPGPHAVRVVFDPAARLDGRARVFSDAAVPTLWLCDSRHADAAQARLPAGRAEVLAVPGLLHADPPTRGANEADRPQSPDMARAVAALAARGLRLLLVEGGGVTVSRCLAAGVLDRLHLVVAPVIIGAGRRGLQHAGPARMADCARPPAQRLALGEDMLWDMDLDLGARLSPGGLQSPGA